MKNYFEDKARKGKEFNVCVFNVPEEEGEDNESNYQNDIKKLKKVFDGKVCIKADDVKVVYRIGTKKPDAKRPFIMKFNSMTKRQEVLTLRNLFCKNKNDEDGDRVFVQPDRTRKEVEERKVLVSELRLRRKNGEEGIGIRNGKIIKFGNPFQGRPQFAWGM